MAYGTFHSLHAFMSDGIKSDVIFIWFVFCALSSKASFTNAKYSTIHISYDNQIIFNHFKYTMYNYIISLYKLEHLFLVLVLVLVTQCFNHHKFILILSRSLIILFLFILFLMLSVFRFLVFKRTVEGTKHK